MVLLAFEVAHMTFVRTLSPLSVPKFKFTICLPVELHGPPTESPVFILAQHSNIIDICKHGLHPPIP